MNKTFTQAGIAPSTWVLDNETSGELEEFRSYNVKYQFVTPHSYQSDLAERANQTFKNHFVSGLA